jgi:excisionase family DNA binding protein
LAADTWRDRDWSAVRLPGTWTFCRRLPLTSGWLRPVAVEEELTDPTARQGVNDEDRATGMRQSADERLAYRPAELAALVGLSTKAIYRAIERGELQAARVANGSRLLVPAAATEEWLESNSAAPRRARKPRRRFQPGDVGQPLREALARLEDASRGK